MQGTEGHLKSRGLTYSDLWKAELVAKQICRTSPLCITRASTALTILRDSNIKFFTESHTHTSKICTQKRVKGAIEVGMSSCEDSNVEEERPGVLDDALKGATCWLDLECTYNIPKLSIKNIHQYFIKRKAHKDQVTASKPFERGHCTCDVKKEVYIYRTNDDNLVLLGQQYYRHKQQIRRMKQLL